MLVGSVPCLAPGAVASLYSVSSLSLLAASVPIGIRRCYGPLPTMLQPETVRSSAVDTPTKSGLNSLLRAFAATFLSGQNASPVASGLVNEPLKRKAPKPTGYKSYTLAEIREHSTPNDAWVIVENKVYDVSLMQHPGGPVLFSMAGQDATEVFHAMHKNKPVARAILKAHLIGEVADPQQTELLRDWTSMREDFERRGLMNASPLYYFRKVGEVVGLAVAALCINIAYPSSILAVLCSAFLMANCFYQCGWLQHDYQHNAVFRSHKLNGLVGSCIIGLGIGGSAHWWKTKHNQHHATPNKMDADTKAPVDPDIDTVPLIAWNADLLKQVPAANRGIIVLQHILVWPLLLVALVNWQMQSLLHALSFPAIPPKTRRFELVLLGVHHAWVLALSFVPLGFKLGLLHWCLSHALGGFVTSFVFIQSHNGMEIYTDDKDFVTSQMVSTRNINPGLINDWVMGGLNYQIEHHLFPTMPRHSFSRVKKDIMQFCARHGLPYESCTLWESTCKVYQQLAAIARLA